MVLHMMIVTEKTRKALKDIGLTDYESTAYTFLLTSGSKTANQISKSTGLPYSKIYDVLASLEEKGWVVVEGGRPKKYYPKPPSEALEAMKMRVERSLGDNVGQILGELQVIYREKGNQERPDIWIVRGEFNILAKMREIFNSTRNEIMVATNVLPRALVNLFLPDLTRLKNLGVNIKIILTENIDDKSLSDLERLGEIKLKEKMFGGGLISDHQSVMLLLSGGKDSETLAICSDHIGLASLSREYFEYLWNEAKPSHSK
ncbi:MAG: HTH-type transcriptional regulator, sugar sensing transcriptional regulator [Thermoproteota archaeon]|nr:HTH-type transcriptional regulator, sugar sensing transcriptional regulator [Thermoproteota archaeon]